MELVFNELSINPNGRDSFQGSDLAIQFSKTMGEVEKFGYNRIRSDLSESEIQLAENFTLYDWLTTNSNDPITEQLLKPFLFGVITTPFINEAEGNIVDEYITADFYFQDSSTNFPKTKCLGLASAYLSDTLSISLPTINTWQKNILPISIEQDETILEDVLNIHSTQCLEESVIKNHIEYATEINLKKTDLKPEAKNFHLTGHHGQKELKHFWNKVRRSSYVVSGLTIDWGGNNFIRNTNENGQIEIVLLKTDRKYAIQIQTTGSNQRETDEIAEILRNKFEK